MIPARFSLSAFREAGDPGALCEELSAALAERLRAAADRWAEEKQIIAELRDLGHDLWSFDDDGDGGAWCADWTRPRSGPTLVLTTRRAPDSEREVGIIASFGGRT